MTNEEIIELAKQAGFPRGMAEILGMKGPNKFAKLIAEKEREECAKLCDYVYNNIVTDEHIKNMAFKIRARGQE